MLRDQLVEAGRLLRILRHGFSISNWAENQGLGHQGQSIDRLAAT